MKRLCTLIILIVSVYNITYDANNLDSKVLNFDDLKHFLYYFESTNGKYKYAENWSWKCNNCGTIHNSRPAKCKKCNSRNLSAYKLLSVDVGELQINSRHFDKSKDKDKELASVVDSIFTAHKVSKKYNERVIEVIRNDKLCYDLGKMIYERRGIDEWTSYVRFKHLLQGYKYHTSERKK